jgi:hypothetical protein
MRNSMHVPARGLEGKDESDADGGIAEGFKALRHNKPMATLEDSCSRFHLGNGATLPLYGLAVVGAGTGNARSRW